nr:uncharacterized protein LOC111426328 [Onthophagus taurus]
MEVFEDKKNNEDLDVIRGNLREKFLRLLTQLNGKECLVNMFENTKVSCITRAFEPNLERVLVENLKTPLPNTLKSAILRCNDIISMEYNL